MKQLHKLFAALAACTLFSALGQAQTGYSTVSTTLLGGTGNLVANGTIYWQPVNGDPGAPTGGRISSSGGQITLPPYQAAVTAGASSVSIPDALSTDPNICYAVTVVNNVTGAVILGAGLDSDGHVNVGGLYGCIQPTGSTWNFDTYVPPAEAPTIYEPVPGPTGPPGLTESAGDEVPSYLATGSDEGTKLQNTINGFISSPGSGRAVSETSPTKTTAITWAVNPFASLLNSNGSVNESDVYQLAVQIQPWQTVTTDAELDLGQYSEIDCADNYSAYDPALGTAGIIQPEASGYPTTTLVTMGPSTTATGSTLATQGNRLQNCGLFANGLSGMTGVLNGWGQEGTKLSNLRITNFMVGIDVDSIAVAPGSGHNYGIYDTQVEMNEGIDSTIWGLRYGHTGATQGAGIAENISTIGGSNNTGITKYGIEDDGSQLQVKNQLCESLTICLFFNELHSGQKTGAHYDGIYMDAANAAIFAVAEDGGVAADSYTIDNVDAGDIATNVFVDKEQPTFTMEKLAGDSNLSSYIRETPPTGIHSQPIVKSSDFQSASVNGPSGDSFENGAAWPYLLLPGKLVSITFGSFTYTGTHYMATGDMSGGVIPFGIALNGDLAAATSSTSHSVSLVRSGMTPCIFDGATTAGDVVVLSSGTVYGSAVGCHDSGSTSLPSSGVYLGYVRHSVASIPSTPSAPTVTTTCTSGCSTTYSYEWVMRNSEDPFDATQSAPGSAGSVSGPAVLTTASGGANQGSNSITSPTGCSFSTPCDLYRTVGGATGFVGEYHSTSNVADKGMIGNGLLPTTAGIIAPAIDVMIGSASTTPLATNSTPGLAQCDGTTITCTTGIISTAAGTPLSHWSAGGGTLSTSSAGVFASTANTQYAQDVNIPAQVNFNQMCVYVQTLDSNGSDLYNLALVKLSTPTCTGSSCATTTVAAWHAPQALTATGATCVANGTGFGTSGNVTITPGNYYMIATGNATTAKFAATSTSNQQFSSLTNLSAGTSSSGAFGTITLNVLSSGVTVGATVQPQAALTLTQ